MTLLTKIFKKGLNIYWKNKNLSIQYSKEQNQNLIESIINIKNTYFFPSSIMKTL